MTSVGTSEESGDKGVKCVPPDIVLTPKVVLFWFLCDGSTQWLRRPSGSKLVRLRLHTNGFTYDDVSMLVSKLQGLHPQMRFTISRSSEGGPVIESSRSDTVRAFFEYIGDPPEELAGCECMEWKWKIP